MFHHEPPRPVVFDIEQGVGQIVTDPGSPGRTAAIVKRLTGKTNEHGRPEYETVCEAVVTCWVGDQYSRRGGRLAALKKLCGTTEKPGTAGWNRAQRTAFWEWYKQEMPQDVGLPPAKPTKAEAAVQELYDKLTYLLDTFVITEDGTFTFPDGDTWACATKYKGDKEKE